MYLNLWLVCGKWSTTIIILHCNLIQSERRNSRRLICSVATESPKQVEETTMDMPKEIFLKDYKSPDYYFDTVRYLISSSGMSRLLEHTNFPGLHIQNMKILDAYGCHFITLCHLLLLCAQVDLKFTLGEEKTIVYSNIGVYPRVEGINQLFFSISIFNIIDLPCFPIKRLPQPISLKLNRTTWAEIFYSIVYRLCNSDLPGVHQYRLCFSIGLKWWWSQAALSEDQRQGSEGVEFFAFFQFNFLVV